MHEVYYRKRIPGLWSLLCLLPDAVVKAFLVLNVLPSPVGPHKHFFEVGFVRDGTYLITP